LVICLMTVLLGVFVSASLQPAMAADIIKLEDEKVQILSLGSYVEILEDKTGKLSIDDVTSDAYAEQFVKHNKDTINLGISNSVFWLRFTLLKNRQRSQVSEDTDQNRFLLDLDAQFVYYADLYSQYSEHIGASEEGGKKVWNVQSRGGFKKLDGNELVYRNVAFHLPEFMPEPTTFYLRVESKSPLFIPLRIIKADAFSHILDYKLILFGLFYGLMLGLFLYNLSIYIFVKDKTYLYYLMYLLTIVAYFLAMNRLTTEFFFRQNPIASSYFSLFFLGIASCFNILYAQSFLNTKKLMRRVHQFLNLLIIPSLGLSVGIFIFDYRLMNQCSTILGLIVPISLLAAGIIAARRGNKNARFYIISSYIVLIGIFVYALMFLAVLPYNFLNFYSFQIATGFEAVLLSIALADKIRLLNQDLSQALNRVNLGYYDSLTGLNNRRFFEEELQRVDMQNNFPLTIVTADVNGLKLANDVFGHVTGDLLLKRTAEIISLACRAGDIVVRTGGDEFAIILQRTDALQGEKLIQRILLSMNGEKVEGVSVSVSFGLATKHKPDKAISEVLKEADQRMYEHKLSERGRIRHHIFETIKTTFYGNNPREHQHAEQVSELCVKLGKALKLSSERLHELQIASNMHDVGKITIKKTTLEKTEPLNPNEWREIKRHAENGYKILSSVNEYAGLAEFVLAHHERYDGTGYPAGLKGDDIPLEARIIAIAEAYICMTSDWPYRSRKSVAEAICEIKIQAGKQFDPVIVDVLQTILNEL